MANQRFTARPGFAGRIGRGLAKMGANLGYADAGVAPPGRPSTSRGYVRDNPTEYTTAPPSSRMIWELHRLRDVSRQMHIKMPIVKAFTRWADNSVIGADPCRLDFALLSDEDNARLRPVITWLRRRWMEHQAMPLDANGGTLRDLGRSVLRAALVDGDCFVLPYKEDGTRKYQAFPGDSLAEQFHGPLTNGHQRELGVEIDKKGKVLAYHFGWQAEHRPLSTLSQTAELHAVRVSADRVWHIIPDARGPQELRGVPWISGAVDEISRLDQFYGAFTRGAIKRSSVGIALEQDPERALMDDLAADDRSAAELAALDGEASVQGIDDLRDEQPLPYQEARSHAGDDLLLAPGYKATTINTGSPSAQEAQLIQMLESRICGALRVSPSTLLGDYKGVSFSAGQLAVQQERSTVEQMQMCLRRSLYDGVYRHFFQDQWPVMLREFMGTLTDADKMVLGKPGIKFRRYPVLERSKAAKGAIDLFAAGLITAAEAREELGLDTSDMQGTMQQTLADREMIGVPAAPLDKSASSDTVDDDADEDMDNEESERGEN